MKRFVCFLLALILVLGLIPNAAVTANAASNWTVSDKAINVLKEYTSFTAKPYQVDGSWYIGYGTKIDGVTTEAQANAKYPDGIEKADALALLKTYINNTANKAVNNMAAKLNLGLTQNQHDALVVFTYSYGSGWITSGNKLYEAVRTGKTGDAFLNVITSSEYVGVTVDNAEGFKAAMNRRLSEANMYNNNSYGYNAPGNYTYVILDMDGDEVVESSDGYQVYNTASGSKVTLNPASGTESFLGWYIYDGKDDDKINGQAISNLNADTSRKILVAKKAQGDQGVYAGYTVNTANLLSRYVFNTTYDKNTLDSYKGSMDEKAKGVLANGTNFVVDTEKMAKDANGNYTIKWMRGVGQDGEGHRLEGWVYIGELPVEGTSSSKIVATAKANVDITICAGATKDSGNLGTLPAGTTVNVYEIKAEASETGNKSWGKITYNGITGWINLVYATVNEYAGATDTPNGRTGKIINTDEVNVRSGAGTGYGKITTLKNGTDVTVLETTMVGDAQWGKVRWSGLKDGYTEGWVYMHYVEVKGLEHSNPDGSTGSKPETVIYTGIVTSNINLNVRSYADVYAPKVTSLPNGTKVNVYETTESRNMKWGRIGADQWVCLTYLKLTKVDAPASGNNATGTTTTLQGTVISTTLNVLKNYNSNAEVQGTLKKGDVVTILEKNTETTTTGSRIWGRISKDGVAGWINLAYVDLKTVTSVGGNASGNTTPVNGVASVIANCLSVNIRESAGVYSTQLTKLNNGTAVTVYEEITHDGAPWARIKWNNGSNEGWVCMYYVTKNVVSGNAGATPEGGTVAGTSSNAISATGYVNNHFLNVRGGAGLGFAQLGTLAQGAKVTIFEQVVADGLIWGKIMYNNTPAYVCMSYITVENVSSTGKGVMGTVARCFSKANVRSAPGTNNALVATVNVGSRVEVFETRSHASQLWGRIPQGWICMDYVLLDSELPEGTVLDATTAPTTVPTTAPTTEVKKEGEVAFKIEAKITASADKPVNVYNDANTKSDRVGTIGVNLNVDIRALKNNGGELWGRIDQYGTAGWIRISDSNINYWFDGYVNEDDAPVYVDANTSSSVKGRLAVNKEMHFTKVTTDGTNVYGWVEDSIYGWLPMSKISSTKTDVLRVYQSGESVGVDTSNPTVLNGTTFAELNAYDVIGGSKVLFKMKSGVKVIVTHVRFEGGKIWACAEHPTDFGEHKQAWFDLSKVNYALAADTEVNNVRVRSSMDNSTTEDNNPNNIVGKVSGLIQICQLSFDSYGNLWARITNHSSNAQLNGMFVMVRSAAQGVDGYEVKNYGKIFIGNHDVIIPGHHFWVPPTIVDGEVLPEGDIDSAVTPDMT